MSLEVLEEMVSLKASNWSDAGLGDAGLGGELGVKGGSSIKGSDLSDDAGLSIKGALGT